jgi:DNA-binding MarR family transcriptional regulator
MSRELVRPDFVPLIALATKAGRALQADMVVQSHQRGYPEIQPSHNAVFATLPPEGARAADMANRFGITRQSMGEVIRDMAELGLVEMVPDPADGRAKIVRFTEYGGTCAQQGFNYIQELDQVFRDKFGSEAVDATYRVLAGVLELLGED